MIITRTSYRCSLFGGSTDMKSFYSEHSSLLIGFALDKYCYILCRKTPQILPHHTTISYAKTEVVKDNNEIEHNGVRGVLEFLKIKHGLEISIHGDLPARTGLGSSSTFVTGLLKSLKIYKDKKELAKDAIYVERHLLREPGGIQDQIWAAYGGFNSIEIKKNGEFYVRPMPMSPEFLEEFRSHLLLLYLGRSRNSWGIARDINQSNDTVMKNKLRIYEIAKQAYSHFEQENIPEIGKLLDESWQNKRAISPLISNKNIDMLYESVIRMGAWGGKLLGSGGSGFLLFVAPPETHQKIKENTKLVDLPINFDFGGSQIVSRQNGV